MPGITSRRARSDRASHAVGEDVFLSSQDVPKGRLILAIALFWTFYGAITATVGLEIYDWNPDVATEVVLFGFGGAYAWALLTLPMSRVVHAIQTSHLAVGIRTALLVVLGLLAGVLVATAVVVAAIAVGGVMARNGFLDYFRSRITRDVLAAYLVLMAGVAWSYLHSLSVRLREAAALRAQLMESRLESLRAQLNPHLLFNTLNAIAALATIDPPRVQRSIAQLSDLLRYMLAGSSDQEVTVAQEFAILERYFEILELRYGEWLRTTITGDAEALAAFVPNLILQPLAENALKHGVGKAGEGSIEVRAAREADILVLTVVDSGPGHVSRSQTSQTSGGGGFGLRHTRERLEQLYAGKYGFQLRPISGGTVVEVRIPYHTEPIVKAS